MKNLFLSVALAISSLTFTACDKNEETPLPQPETAISHKLDATSKTTWHYINLEDNKVVASCEMDSKEEEAMKDRSDWDIAIKRYEVRTNSGTSTNEGKGGIFTCAEDVTFQTLQTLPSSIKYTVDKEITKDVMGGGTVTISVSTAVVSIMEGMPPTWLKSPLYLLKDATGKKTYKVDFLGYKDDKGTSGHVSFQYAEIK